MAINESTIHHLEEIANKLDDIERTLKELLVARKNLRMHIGQQKRQMHKGW